MIRTIYSFIFVLLGWIAADTINDKIVYAESYAPKQIVNLYSAQKEHLIRPILDEFEKETGIHVNMTSGDKAELVTRLEHEGENTQADLLLTVDIGNIYQAKSKGLLQKISSQKLNNIPEYLRDSEGQWYALTLRSRLIFYNIDKVEPDDIQSYSDLADEKWRKKLLIRSSSNVYNQSLTSSLLKHNGAENTKKWLAGIVANLARNPQGGDSDQLKALAAGEGDIAVANSYYYARLVDPNNKSYNKNVAEKVAILFPDQGDKMSGAHVNIRGGGVTKYAKNKENAIALMEFLASEKAQRFFADKNLEYPVLSTVKPNEEIGKWGKIKWDQLPLEEIGALQQQAISLMDEAGWR